MATIERDVEARFRRMAKRCGGWALKLVSPGNSGMPDRVAILPNGELRLVELKAPGEKPRPLQVRMFSRLAKRGHPVTVIDSLEGVDEFWSSAS